MPSAHLAPLAQADPPGPPLPPYIIYAGIAILAVVLLVLLASFFKLGRMWIQATTAGVGDEIGFFSLIAMLLRRVSPAVILNSLIIARKAGLKEVTRAHLEAQYMAGGKLERVAGWTILRAVALLVDARSAGRELTFAEACARDLSGRAEPPGAPGAPGSGPELICPRCGFDLRRRPDAGPPGSAESG